MSRLSRGEYGPDGRGQGRSGLAIRFVEFYSQSEVTLAKLFIGQGHGFIRLTNEREVFFHRADVKEGTAFNDLQIGDTVTFELFEDPVSGSRALHVARRDPAR